MRLTLKALTLLILLPVAACATRPAPIILTPGQLICPASVLNDEVLPETFNREILQTLPPETRTYILQREVQWEAVAAAGTQAKADALRVCADYNRALRELQNEAAR